MAQATKWFNKINKIPFVIILIFIAMCFASPYFLSTSNIYGLFDSMPAYGLTALGLTFVLMCGEFDISGGSVMALTACIFMMTLPKFGFGLSTLLALLLGCLCGAVTGFFVSKVRIAPFVVTMTMQLIYKGIALTITNSTPVSSMDDTLLAISSLSFLGIPITFYIFLLAIVIAQLVLLKTQYGRNLYIIGGNVTVANNLGLKTGLYIWSTYVIQGFLAAFGALIMLTRTFSASGNLAIDAPLSVIPMAIIGGTSFSGGKGSALCTLWGVLLMCLIFNAMSMFNLYVNIQQLIKGAIMLIIIVSDKYMENRYYKV